MHIFALYAFQELWKNTLSIIMINRKFLFAESECALCSAYLKKRMWRLRNDVQTTCSIRSQIENGFYCRIVPITIEMCKKKIPRFFRIRKFSHLKIYTAERMWQTNKFSNRSHCIHSDYYVLMNSTNVLRKYSWISFRKRYKQSPTMFFCTSLNEPRLLME